LNLRGCSKTPEFSVGTVNNATLAILISNCRRKTLISTGASFTGREIEDQGVFGQFAVTFGEIQHGRNPDDSISIKGHWGPLDEYCATYSTVTLIKLRIYDKMVTVVICK
jgi:hypothetical protein